VASRETPSAPSLSRVVVQVAAMLVSAATLIAADGAVGVWGLSTSDKYRGSVSVAAPVSVTVAAVALLVASVCLLAVLGPHNAPAQERLTHTRSKARPNDARDALHVPISRAR